MQNQLGNSIAPGKLDAALGELQLSEPGTDQAAAMEEEHLVPVSDRVIPMEEDPEKLARELKEKTIQRFFGKIPVPQNMQKIVGAAEANLLEINSKIMAYARERLQGYMVECDDDLSEALLGTKSVMFGLIAGIIASQLPRDGSCLRSFESHRCRARIIRRAICLRAGTRQRFILPSSRRCLSSSCSSPRSFSTPGTSSPATWKPRSHFNGLRSSSSSRVPRTLSQGQLTTLLGNLSLLSYFAGRRERGAMAVQTVGVLTTMVVLFQLGIAGDMALAATTGTVVIGLALNFLYYMHLLPETFWEGFITVGGPTVLLQVMWSTFEPFLPRSALPGVVTGFATLSLIALVKFQHKT